MSLDVYLLDEVGELFTANITHNLANMAEEAGIYKHLWRPEEIGITHAHQLIMPLQTALAQLRADPARFEKFNPENGWGNYQQFVLFVERYWHACVAGPDTTIEVCR